MLKEILSNLEGLDDTLKGLYAKQEDGTFVLELDGKDTKKRLDEFRDNNVNYLKERDAALKANTDLQKQYKGVDLNAYKAGQAALAQITDAEERKLLSENKFEEVYSRRNKNAQAHFSTELAARQTAIEERDTTITGLRATLGKTKVEQELQRALSDSGVRVKQNAMDDLLSRVHSTFRVDDNGDISPMANGSIIRGAKGDPLTMLEGIQSWASGKGSHLFETGGGGGAQGSGSGSGSNRQAATGKIRVNRRNPREMAKYHKEISEDKVIFVDN